MSNKIDLKHYENKYTFETPADPNWKGEPWTTADLKVILDELKRCYEEIDTFHPLHGLEVWDEDPDYSRAEWREEVAEGHVTSGYWRWVSNQYLASE
jgi:hypothetical protein